ncbi:MAG: hypothetical protein FJ295_00475 [Planctomycetes bacterium]|nr:hypothetical protein [Planctomycetota bacterium]
MVAKKYAGILGIVAFLTMLTRGAMHDAGLEGTVMTSCGGAIVFAALGFLLGLAAESIVTDAVRRRFVEEMNRAESAATKPG